MKKKTEIILAILIIVITIGITIYFYIPKNNGISASKNETTTSNSSLITITVTGEVIEEINIQIPKGQTYRYIINSIKPYLNDYSIIDSNLAKRYYEDTIIIIETNDKYSINKEEIENIIISDSKEKKININDGVYFELISLYGIGEKRAYRIIDRLKEEKFTSFEELKSFLGVSYEVIEHIKEQATIE